MKRLFLGMIRLYQLLFSSLTPRQCCHYPTCSAYGADAIRRFGALRGGWLAFARLCRCHPFSHGGYDPVPEKWENPLRAARKRLGRGACCVKNPPIPPT